MAEQRSINLLANSVDVNTVRRAVGAEQFYRAIGYLSSWNMTFPKVGISVYPEDNQIVAAYCDEADTRRFVIVAVWDEASKTYSFNS